MKVLVAGPYPPAADQAALDVLRQVQRLQAEGHDVEVLSPHPSAAEHHGPLTGLRGALLLARMARRYDALHLHVGRFMLFRPELPQARRLLDSALIGVALRRWRRCRADLGDLSDIPGGGGGLSGRLVWGAVDEITVAGEPTRTHAVKALHLPAARVRAAEVAPGVPQPAAPVPRAVPQPPWQLPPDAGWAEVMRQVHERARAAVTDDEP